MLHAVDDDDDEEERRPKRGSSASARAGGRRCGLWILVVVQGLALCAVALGTVVALTRFEARLGLVETDLGVCQREQAGLRRDVATVADDAVNATRVSADRSAALRSGLENATATVAALGARVDAQLATVRTNDALADLVDSSVAAMRTEMNVTRRDVAAATARTVETAVTGVQERTEDALEASVAAQNATLARFAKRQAERDAEIEEAVDEGKGALDATAVAHRDALERFANATTREAQASLRQTAERSEAAVEALNGTVAAALGRIDEREREFDAALVEAEAELASTAASIEGRLAESTGRLADLEGSMADYETDTAKRFDKQSALLRSWIAGFFALLAAILTFRHIYSHTTRMAFPEAQRKVLAILWMVPIYALSSWAAIVWPSAALEVQLFSSIYEAYTVYMFFALLVAILSDGQGEDEAIATLPATMRSPLAPSRWCWPWKADIPAKTFLSRCKLMTLQFVVCKPVLAVLDYAFSRTVRFRGELLDATKPEMYITILLNVSVSVALTALLGFFHATQKHERLAAHQPWPKFVAIKGVVFLTWFQGVAITLALRLQLGALADADLAAAFQNFLVCVEMFVAALAHSHIFGADEWQPDYKPLRMAATVADNLALNDFVRDFRSVLPRLRRRNTSNKGATDAKAAIELLAQAPPPLKDDGDDSKFEGAPHEDEDHRRVLAADDADESVDYASTTTTTSALHRTDSSDSGSPRRDAEGATSSHDAAVGDSLLDRHTLEEEDVDDDSRDLLRRLALSAAKDGRLLHDVV